MICGNCRIIIGHDDKHTSCGVCFTPWCEICEEDAYLTVCRKCGLTTCVYCVEEATDKEEDYCPRCLQAIVVGG